MSHTRLHTHAHAYTHTHAHTHTHAVSAALYLYQKYKLEWEKAIQRGELDPGKAFLRAMKKLGNDRADRRDERAHGDHHRHHDSARHRPHHHLGKVGTVKNAVGRKMSAAKVKAGLAFTERTELYDL